MTGSAPRFHPVGNDPIPTATVAAEKIVLVWAGDGPDGMVRPVTKSRRRCAQGLFWPTR
jgi:hypothetical protein